MKFEFYHWQDEHKHVLDSMKNRVFMVRAETKIGQRIVNHLSDLSAKTLRKIRKLLASNPYQKPDTTLMMKESQGSTSKVKRNVVDSGTTSNVVGTNSHFVERRKCPTKNVQTAGHDMQITETGTVPISVIGEKRNVGKLMLTDALVSERLVDMNLISVAKLARQGFQCIMDTKLVIRRMRDGKIIATGRLADDNLYELDAPSEETIVCESIFQNTENPSSSTTSRSKGSGFAKLLGSKEMSTPIGTVMGLSSTFDAEENGQVRRLKTSRWAYYYVCTTEEVYQENGFHELSSSLWTCE